MKVLITGASSFTGYWFAKELAEAGHTVTATLRRPVDDYDGLRRQRVDGLASFCELSVATSFGDEAFLALVGKGWDRLCHHAADVTDYKSDDFDVNRAVLNNTRRAKVVLQAAECPLILTGSVFEGGEGAGSQGLPHFSPYGLSKSLTSDMFRYYAESTAVPMGKFVIPNPFGPFEEPRFTNYLVKTWFAGKIAGCNTPAYVRDNIHVGLLAKAYRDFVESVDSGLTKFGPAGYIESQGAFAQRFASEMRTRLQIPCELELASQVEFTEPRIRMNTDSVDGVSLGFDESAAWDALADYYISLYGNEVVSS